MCHVCLHSIQGQFFVSFKDQYSYPASHSLFTRLLPHSLSSVIVYYLHPSVPLGQIIFLCADNLVLGCHELTLRFCTPRVSSLKRMIYIKSWQVHLFSFLFMSFLFPNCTNPESKSLFYSAMAVQKIYLKTQNLLYNNTIQK